jgi:fibronectin type 3 domain-containing protein
VPQPQPHTRYRPAFLLKVLVPVAAILTALLLPGTGRAWTLNEIQLDTNYCRTNLQLGSDKTASNSNTPSFLLSGDGGLSAYNISIDGSPLGRFNSDGFGNVCIYTSLPLSEGQHTITGTEITPHSTYVAIPLTFTVDTVPPPAPSTPVMSPVSDKGIPGDNITNVKTFTVTGTSDQNSGISLVRIMRGGQFIVGGATPSAGVWASAASMPFDGQFAVQSMAVDEAANNSALSAPLNVTIDTVLPTNTVTNPAAGAIVSGTIPFSASASDASGILSVAFQVDGVTKSTVTSAPYTYMWNTGTVPNGSHTLTAVATDIAGNTTSTPVAVTVANSAATVPGSPQAFANAGNNNVSLLWTTPADGGSPITGYKIYRGMSSGGELLLTTLGNVTSWTDSTAMNGTTYYYQVTAVNSVGESIRSGEVSALPSGLPGAPTLQSAVAGNGSVTLSWSAANGNGSAVTSYTATSSVGGFTCTTGSLGCTVSGLANGTTYTFTVTATNAIGTGPASNAMSATPSAPSSTPGAPTLSSATAGNGSVTLAWTAAAPNGSPVTSYTATSSPGGFTCTTSSLGCTVSGLANGTTYSFTVIATNANGNGPASNALSATPAGLPGAPTLNSATAGSNSVTLSWSAAAPNGSPVTSYTATSSPGGFTCTTSGLGCSVSGLTNGTTYSFTVKATNGVGTGAASNALSATPVAAVTVPGAPTLNSASRGSSGGTVDLAWAAPASNGGAPITSYTATSSPGGFTCTTASLGCTVGGLTNGTSYSFTVTATNSAGTGSPSNALSATPAALPGAPTLSTAVGGLGIATLTWLAAPANGSPITSYTVTSSPGGFTCTTALLTCVVSGLTNGVNYSFTVTATNGVGTGPASNALFTIPAGLPGAPTLTSASRGNGSVTLGWSAAAGNGSSVTSYTATSSPGGFTCTSGSLACTVSGLTNGTTYTFTVTATNGVGTGPASNALSATPAAVPSAPVLTSAAPSNGSVLVGWSAANGNGSAVSSYTVTSSPGGFTCTTAGLSCSVGGLTNGTSYTFTVTATNAVGVGPASNSMSATPFGPPGAPGLTSAVGGNASVTLGWTAAAANGSAVTSYTATSSPGGFTCTTSGLGCTVSGLTNGTSYTFTVTATNGAGAGPASNAMSATPSGVPSAPGLTSATGGNGSATLTWTAAAGNGSPVSSYTATSSPGGFTCTTSALGCTVSGLTNGVSYSFTVTATNGVGTGPASNALSAVPAGLPGAPTLTTAARGNGSVTLGWSAAASNGSTVTSYTATSSPGGFTCTSGSLGCTVSGLTNGTTYTFTVTATNGVGTGPASNSMSATPAAVPTAPVLTSAAAGNGSVQLAWSAANGNGLPVSSYTATSSPGGFTCSTSALGCTVGGLTNGTTYTFTVTATNAVGTGPASNSLSATPAGLPGAPSLTSATGGDGSVTLGWSAAAANGSTVTSYTATSTTGGFSCTTGSLGCTVSGLTNGTTYTFTVTATNGVGTGPASNSMSATPGVSGTAPGVPTLMFASAGDGRVTLTWLGSTDGGSPITGYNIYRSTLSGRETFLTTIAPSGNYTDNTVANGTNYYYMVTAVNAVGESGKSNERGALPVGKPAAPNLFAPTVAGASVSLSWSFISDGGSPITGVNVYRGTTSGNETLLTTLGNVTSFTDSNLPSGNYFYTVTAVNSYGEGAASTERSATIAGSTATVPSAPSLTATAGNANVALSWNAPANGGSAITGYNVYRGTVSGGETLVASLGNQLSWNDGNAANGTTYYYQVTAVNSVGEGARSTERPATPSAPATVPSAPGLTASAGNGVVGLSWNAPANGGSAITGYNVYRSTFGGGETLYASLGTQLSWNDTSVVNGTTYYYQVTAVNGVGESARSTEQPAKPTAPATLPGAPSLVAASPGTNSISLDWDAPTSDGGATVSNYNVYRGTFSGGETLLTTVGTQTAYVDTSAAPGVTYYYQVTAVNSVGEGGKSNELSTALSADTTPPSVPTNVKLAIAGTSQMAIYWTASTGDVVAYDIYRDGQQVGSSTVANYLDSGVAAGSTHSYTVKSRDAAGNASAASSALSAKAASVSGSSSTVAGVVYSSGKPIANVVVTLTASGVNKSTKTSTTGVYKFSNLKANLTYTVTVSGKSSSVLGGAGQVVLVATNL